MFKFYFTKSIVEAIKNRDSEVFEFLDRKYLKKVIAHVRKNSSNNPEQDGEDLYNDSILETIKVIDREGYNFDISFGAFFYRVYQRRWLRNLNSNQPQNFLTTNNVEEIIGESIKFEEVKFFYNYFSRLSSLCQDILSFVMKGFNQREIAEKLNMNHDAIRQKRGRCIAQIRKWIEEDRGYDSQAFN